ncbi:hypothetical protein PTKIN_Ptkin11bG0059800 [Pterospermum kingtungense]
MDARNHYLAHVLAAESVTIFIFIKNVPKLLYKSPTPFFILSTLFLLLSVPQFF